MLTAENLDSKIKKFWPKDGPSTQEIKKYLKKYSKEKIVIKCGGRVLLDPILFENFIKDVVTLKKLGLTPLLVHGGGLGIKKKLDESNIKSNFIMGLRVTDEKMIKIVEDVMVEFNKEIVETLEKESCKAKSITIRENNVIYVRQKNKELGYVGSPNRIDDNLIKNFIDKDFIPVIAPMGVDETRQAYNINADTAAGAIAKELKSRRLLLMTDIEGVMDSNNNLVTEIKPEMANKMIEDGIIKGGMIPKLQSCIDALDSGVDHGHIINANDDSLVNLFNGNKIGTHITRES